MPRRRASINIVENISQPPAQQINVNITPYQGDPDTVVWFTQQILSLKEINNWSQPVALLQFKSKLAGNALKWFSTSPTCADISTIEDACCALINFFKEISSPSCKLLEFQGIVLEHNESIKNLSHRIQTSAVKTYPLIDNQRALSQIMSLQLLTALPPNLKKQLLTEDTTDFDKLVVKASKLQNAENALTLTSNNVNTINSDTAKQNDLDKLQLQISQLTLQIANQNNSCSFCKENHTLANCPSFKMLINKQSPAESTPINHSVNHMQASNSYNRNNASKSLIKCHFCNKVGHIMANCRAYLASLNSQIHAQNFQPRYRYPHSNYNYRYPNIQQHRYFNPQSSQPYQQQSFQYQPQNQQNFVSDPRPRFRQNSHNDQNLNYNRRN